MTISLNIDLEISQLLQSSTKLTYEEEPNYEQLRKLFKDALKSLSVSLTSALDFTNPNEKRVSFDSSTDKAKPIGRVNIDFFALRMLRQKALSIDFFCLVALLVIKIDLTALHTTPKHA